MAGITTRGKRRAQPLVGKPGPRASGKPTLRTLAEITGLAITTISRALNNAPELSQETRERVQKLAAEIGYVPDRTALRLKTGRTHVVALILDPHEEVLGFGQSMVGGVAAALRGTPYHLVITPNLVPPNPSPRSSTSSAIAWRTASSSLARSAAIHASSAARERFSLRFAWPHGIREPASLRRLRQLRLCLPGGAAAGRQRAGANSPSCCRRCR